MIQGENGRTSDPLESDWIPPSGQARPKSGEAALPGRKPLFHGPRSRAGSVWKPCCRSAGLPAVSPSAKSIGSASPADTTGSGHGHGAIPCPRLKAPRTRNVAERCRGRQKALCRSRSTQKKFIYFSLLTSVCYYLWPNAQQCRLPGCPAKLLPRPHRRGRVRPPRQLNSYDLPNACQAPSGRIWHKDGLATDRLMPHLVMHDGPALEGVAGRHAGLAGREARGRVPVTSVKVVEIPVYPAESSGQAACVVMLGSRSLSAA